MISSLVLKLKTIQFFAGKIQKPGNEEKGSS